MGSTQHRGDADDRIAQEIFDGEAFLHVDMSAFGIVADRVFAPRVAGWPSAPFVLCEHAMAFVAQRMLRCVLIVARNCREDNSTKFRQKVRARHCTAAIANRHSVAAKQSPNLYGSN
jgi:hypothetical protein